MNSHPDRSPTTRQVLVIDDDQFVRATITAILESSGYEVLEAENGHQGLRVFDENRVDLVVTDILMPEKEGIETILEIRRKNRNVKIIAVSGGGLIGMTEFLDIARKLGADQILPKPFSRADLLDKVRKCLST